MYRQILIDSDQTKYQKILWRNSSDENIRCYDLQTVTYGTASAPYLAVRCLFKIAKDIETEYPIISRIITNDFYVDDVLTGAESVFEALQIQRDLSEVLTTHGFQLRKWLSNSKNVLSNLSIASEIEAGVLQIGEDEQNKTLGIYWNANEDTLQYCISNIEVTRKLTKRNILSIVCQIFDPLGLLGPIIITAKLVIQELWQLKLDWDEAVPQKLQLKWTTFLSELTDINKYKIARYILSAKYSTIELHGFSDASERAYGACIYIRTINANGIVSFNLLCAKSRVAPLKTISLPRLELCGAVLLSNLFKKVIDSLEIKFDNIFLWSDSIITLSWINGEPAKWKTFVANRVSEIQSLTSKTYWNHVKTHENPADLLSRGMMPGMLINNHLWWHGPEFLFKNSAEWQLLKDDCELDVPEMRVTAVSVQATNVGKTLLNKFSSITKVNRIYAIVIRFILNKTKYKLAKEGRTCGPITPKELDFALNILIKIVQKECFGDYYECLAGQRKLPNKSKILNLNPFMHNGLIRVGGRIKNSSLGFDKSHPIFLPKGHNLTELIIRHEHERLYHASTQLLLSSVREKYWPISGRNSCKKIIKNCVVCFKVNPATPEYLMGDLPSVRVSQHAPFLYVGTDFGGPFLLEDRKGRGSKNTKVYICLFVCMSTKAVHLELVTELSTDAFLATLHRFISRRGKPLNIYSDNALNFVGVKNELIKVYAFLVKNSLEIAERLANDRINWHFIPARSPSFGGIWEAGIKSTKFHLKIVIGTQSFTFEEFLTIINKIEAILNSRPLSNDPNDTTALTPAHFLIGKSLTALPEQTLVDDNINRLSRWKRLQAMTQHYWLRWQKEYLAELQTRTKWKQRADNHLKVGSLVLVKDDNCAPMNWPLGRVTKLYPGKDGVLRVIDVIVRGRERRRAVNRVCMLPIDM